MKKVIFLLLFFVLFSGCVLNKKEVIKKPMIKENIEEEEKIRIKDSIKKVNELKEITAKCKCSIDIYDCNDFMTQVEAQALFECCGGVNNDIHKLDIDKDGLAC